MPKQIWAICATAILVPMGVEGEEPVVGYYARVGVTNEAESKAEAVAIGLEQAKRFWPVEFGYRKHQSDATQVPPEWMENTP